MVPNTEHDLAEDECADTDAPTGLARAINTIAGHAIGLVWIVALRLLGVLFGAAASMRRSDPRESTNP